MLAGRCSSSALRERTLAKIPELEELQIRDYVSSQRFPGKLKDDQVEIVQKVDRRRVGSITYDLYDVWMSSGQRWWVITNHTNLYAQEDFKYRPGVHLSSRTNADHK